MPSLVFLAGPIAGRRYKLGDGEYVIGRRSDCQIFVPDMRVSRQHARLWRDGDGWTLEDLGSNNGTYINGVRLQTATQLRHDDEILIANNKIRGEALLRSRDDSGTGRAALVSSGLVSITDQKAVRLIERKLDALTEILRATAASDTEDALLDKIAEALLELFPQAEDVGVLVEDERTRALRVQCQRKRNRPRTEPGATGPRPLPELRIPGTI